MDGAEYQLNRPLGGDALGLQGIGQAEATHHKIWPLGADPLQLAFHVLPLGNTGARWQQGQLRIEQLAIEVGRAHLHQLHAALALQEPRQGELQLGIGQQKKPLTGQQLPVRSNGTLAPLHQRIEHLGHQGRGHPEGSGARRHPGPTALHTKRIRSCKQLTAAAHQGPCRGREEGLGQQHPGAGTNRGQLGGAPRRQARDHRNTQATKKLHQPVFHRIGQGADDQQLIDLAAGHQGNHRQQGLVFSLGEGGFDAAAAVVQHHHPAG